MNRLLITCVFILGLTLAAFCGQISRIELNDGSVIKAEVVSFENGVYTLDNGPLGKISIPASKIKKIEILDLNPASSGNLPVIPDTASLQSKIEQTRNKITNDPEMMKTIKDLANDPQFQEALKDPELVKAAKSGDVNTLMNDDKFMKLLNNVKIKEIENRLQEGN